MIFKAMSSGTLTPLWALQPGGICDSKEEIELKLSCHIQEGMASNGPFYLFKYDQDF